MHIERRTTGGIYRTAMLLALLPAAAGAQQPATINGRVTGEAGQPLTAVNVVLEGMSLGATTNAEGTYGFTVPAARANGQTATLTARRIGYRPRSVQVTLTAGGTISQNFQLELNPLNLGEIVITGAGTQTEAEKLGTARSNVDSAAITRSNEPNIVNALAAKAPNVTVLSSSGEPGASSYIQVRGLTSIASGTGQPLFVVDGLPIDNSTVDTPFSGLNAGTVAMNRGVDINPADIENIEILKGAAAGAIYGARAGQGVVLITTKRGRAGQTRYSLRTNASMDEVGRLPDLQSEYGAGSGYAPPACWVSQTPNCRAGGGSFGPRLAPGTPTYDHSDEIFDTGYSWENTLSASGGNERTTFFLSAGALNQDGIVIGPNNKLERYSVRFNGAHQVFNSLRAGINASYVSTEGAFNQTRNNIAGLMLGAWRTPADFNNRPYLDPETGLHRAYRFPFPAAGSERLSRTYDNPLFSAFEARATSDVGRAFGNINLEYIPTSWLRVNYTLGSDFWSDDRLEALPLTSAGAVTAGEGQVIRSSIRNVSIDHNLTATANYALSERIRGTVTIGQNLNASQQRQQADQGNVLIAPEPFNLGNTSIQVAPFDQRTETRVESYFGQATIDLYDQLFLTAALRNDGASTFGEENRRAWFPKGSVAWSFLREPTLGGAVTLGRLRAAYGESGTQPTPYQTQTIFSSAQIFEGGWGPVLGTAQNGVRGLFTSPTLGNPDLGPERVRELEVGADFGFFQDRADISLTHYRQKTTDAILFFPLQAAGGFANQARNVGELENIGWEASLNIRPVRGETWNWDIGLNWSTNENEVLSLRGANQVVLNAPFGLGSYPQAIVREGEPMGIWLSDDFVRCGRGVIVNGLDIDAAAGHCQGAPAGALYLAESGYPLRDQQGQYLLADPNPDWMGGVRTNIGWKKLSIGGLVDIRQGGDVWNGTRTALNNFGRTAESARYRQTGPDDDQTWSFGGTYLPKERVAGPGVDPGTGAGRGVALGEQWFAGLGGVFNGPASFAFEDGSFVKLREVSVGYLWDTPMVSRLGFSSIEFRLAGRNLATWTDYEGIDPETSVQSAGTSVIRGVDYFNNPQTRSYVVTVTLSR